MHQHPLPNTPALAHHMPRELIALEPFLLEADSPCIARPALGGMHGLLRREVGSEPARPFCGGGFRDEVGLVGRVTGWEGFGGAEGVFG